MGATSNTSHTSPNEVQGGGGRTTASSAYILLDDGPSSSSTTQPRRTPQDEEEQEIFLDVEEMPTPPGVEGVTLMDDTVLDHQQAASDDNLVVPLLSTYANDEAPTDHGHARQHHPTAPELNGLNYLNVVTFLISCFCSLVLGVWGLDHLIPTRWEIFSQYDTLVTPAELTYHALWGPILLGEGVFAAAQLLPHYRSRPIIQEGTSFWFFYTCVSQMAWTLFFSFRLFVLSFACVMLVWTCLANLLGRQHMTTIRGTQRSPQHRMEYWLFRFPFHLHFGWMTVQASVHFALLLRYAIPDDMATQIGADMVALAILLPFASFFLVNSSMTNATNNTNAHDDQVNFVIPTVIAWSYVGIATRLGWILHNPDNPLLQRYGYELVSAFRAACWFFMVIVVGILMIPRAVIWWSHEYCTIQVVQLSADDSYTSTSRSEVVVD